MPHDVPPDVNVEHLDHIDISLRDVTDQLAILDVNKAYGPDGIGPRVLHHLSIDYFKLALTSQKCLVYGNGLISRPYIKREIYPTHPITDQCLYCVTRAN